VVVKIKYYIYIASDLILVV